jgi:hypothetical protein
MKMDGDDDRDWAGDEEHWEGGDDQNWEDPPAKSIAKVHTTSKKSPLKPPAALPQAGCKLKPSSKLKAAVHAVSLRPQNFGLGKGRKSGSVAQTKAKAEVEKDRQSRDGKKVSKPGKGGKLNADGSRHQDAVIYNEAEIGKGDPNFVGEGDDQGSIIPPLTFSLDEASQAKVAAKAKKIPEKGQTVPKKEKSTAGFSKLSAAIRGRRSRETYVKMAKEKRLWAPYVETGPQVVKEMLDLAKTTASDVVVDLGAGDGRICISAAKDYGARAIGVEIDGALVKKCQKNVAAAGLSEEKVSRISVQLLAQIYALY